MHSPSATTTAPLCLPPGIPASARTALGLLQRLQHGSLTLRLPDGSLQHFGPGGGPSAALTLPLYFSVARLAQHFEQPSTAIVG